MVLSGIPWEAPVPSVESVLGTALSQHTDLPMALSQPSGSMCGAALAAWELQQLGFAARSPQHDAPHPSPGNKGRVGPQAHKYKITLLPPPAVRASPDPQHTPDNTRGFQPGLGPLYRGSPGSTGAGRHRAVGGTENRQR